MRRFKFLLSNEFLKLKNLFEERIQVWMKDWTLSPDRNVQISRSSIDSFDIKSSKHLYRGDRNQSATYYIDSTFNWEALAFDSYYGDCPKDDLLNQLMAKIKDSFFADVFGLNQTKNDTHMLSNNSVFKDHILINLTLSDIGTIQLLTQESFLHLLLNIPAPTSERGVLSRFDAIKDMKITAKVSTNLGAIAFLDLINLNIGKLVQSGREIDNQFELKIHERSICNAALGKVGNNKSIIVKGVEK